MLKVYHKFFLAFAVCLTFLSAEVYGQCLTISTSSQSVNCFGGNDGQISVTVNTGVANYTYELYYDDGGLTLLGRIANTASKNVVFRVGNGTLTEPGAEVFGIPANNGLSQYRVSVIASGGGSFVCERKTAFLTVTEPTNALSATINNIDPDCDPSVGSGNGTIDIQPAGGTAPYTYLWSDGAVSQDRSGIDAGPYSVTVTDSKLCTFVLNATVPVVTQANAGADQTVCADNTTLAGNAPGTGEIGTWTVISGTGVFANANAQNTTVGGLSMGANVFEWRITDAPPITCTGTSSNVTITRSTPASVDAGPPQTICNGGTATLAGTFGGAATSVTWTAPTGDGAFVNATSVNATYTPGPNDIAAGTVVLVLTTNDPLGPCPAVSDNVTITINATATVDAGPNQTICAGSTVTLAGTFGGSATGISWSKPGTSDGTFSNITNPSAVFTPGPNDLINGSVILTISTDDPAGPCLPATDVVTLTFNQAATVDAGPAQTICGTSTATLAGLIGGSATSATWSGGTGTFAPNATTLNAVYTPSAAERTAGTVTLTLTTNDPNGPCPSATDNVVITLDPFATVDAGVNRTVCAGTTVTLAGVIGGAATSATWSGGTGTFSPNATTLNAVYTPSAAEITAGTVTLTLTTNDPPGLCSFVTDAMTITITPVATVNAGPDQTICAGNSATLAGTVGGSATGGTWSGGTGTFSPNANTLTATYIPSAAEITAGTVTLTLTTAGPCAVQTDNVVITITPAATVNAGPDQSICSGSTVTLAGTVGGSATGGVWSGGTGTFNPNATTLTAIYTPSGAEVTAGFVVLTLTTTGPCATVNDNVRITIRPVATVNAGPDQTICAGNTATLAGAVGGSATGGTWSGGTGTFAPNANTLNAVYTPSAAERTAGTVTLTLTTVGPCAVQTDNVTITINPAATVNAGPDQTICAGNTATLAGAVGGSATGGTWSGGTGTFAPNATTLNAVYTPSAAERTAGTVTLTLTTTGPCAALTDNVVITITPAATVNAGADQNICSGSTVTLAGVIGGSATGGVWSGGAGTFNPNATTLNAIYTPSAAEVTAGTVTLTLTTTGPCAVATDNVVITIRPVATVNAGPDQTICAGNTATLAGAVGGSATSGTWSGGTGSFAPNATTLNAVYTPSAAEVTAGTVTLTLTTVGPCAVQTDNVTITITPAATVNAGPDQTICSGSTVTLAGVIGGSATGGVWSGGAGTFNPNATTLGAVYTPSAAEVTAGTVTLTLTTTGPCAVRTDNVTITISPVATVNAGPDQTICGGNTVTLAGTVGGSATGGTWSGGTGSFAPNATTLSAVYTPSAAEVTAGTVTLTLTTTGPCAVQTDNVTITINPAATVNAGPDQTICAGSTVTLAGTVGGSATGGVWSGGSGTFTPNANALNGTYTPSPAELTAGTVTLTLSTTGPCAALTDNVTITINAPATVNAGPDQTICSGNTVTLAGTIGGSSTGAVWSGGTGTFNPNATTLSAVYTPSAAEVTAGTVTLTLTTTGPCAVVTDNVVITISPVATVNAGPDQSICAGTNATLAGTVGGSATGGTWSGGTGTFAPNATTLGATYTPSAAEVTAGTVTLTLTTTGSCAAVTDNVTFTITPAATVNAGPDQTICAGSTVTLAGAIGGSAATGTWSGGTGTFAPSNTTLAATYAPSAAEVTAGTVTLTLTTAGPCAVQTDNVVITISPAATVNAGPDQTICGGSTVTLAGTIGGAATGATWSGGTGTFAPNNTTLGATYTPSVAEVTAGTVTLTLTTSGPCAVATDNVTITINPAATVNAGPDQTICAGSTVTLAGSVSGSATGGTWSGGTGTFAPNANTLGAVYTPSTAEVTAGTVTLTLTTTGPCATLTDNVVITITTPATVNAGTDQTICGGSTVTLAGTIGGSSTGAVWSGGTGTFNPNATTLSAIYTPSVAEVTAGTVTLTLTSTGGCAVVTDNVVITITPPATANAGPDQTICTGSTVTLAGAIGGSATSGTWSGGTGTFAPNANTLNATYTPSAADLLAGTVTLTLTTAGGCTVATDDVIININSAPTVNAGPDQTICSGSSATLAGTVGGSATGGVWSGGTGTFNPNSLNLSAVYTPSVAEIGAGSVTLTLTTIGSCTVLTDNVTITISPGATVNAGPDQTICGDGSVTLAGAFGGSATGAAWSGGAGTFAPDANTLNAVYTPSVGEVAAGTVTLMLSSAGPCAVVTDNVIITINAPAIANAGADQIICAGGTVTLAGSFSGSATSATWSGGAGTFAPDANTLTAVYTPSAAEATAGSVTLTLTTNDPDAAGPCNGGTDTIVITISSGATANAGPDQTICAGNKATLAGAFTGAAGITWTTAGDGTFSDATLTNAEYTPGVNDLAAGTVTLTMTTGGPCASVADIVVITINPAATVAAGPDQILCSGGTATLAGSFTGSATGLLWTTAGDGTFSDATDENAIYTPGTADIAAGSVILTATATGTCSGVTDNVTITINPVALVDAGPTQTGCGGSSVTLAGVIGGSATSATWSGGTGTFSPNATTLNATYTPSAAEITSGTVTLTLTTNNPAGPCPAVSDVVVINFTPIPGDQVTFGNEMWIGYVYSDAAAPSPPVSNIDFASAKYKGFIDETDVPLLGASTYNTTTDAFNLNLSNNVPLAGPNVCGSFLNDYSVRFKMRKTFAAGVYTFTVGGDDGVRLLIDGNPIAGVFAAHTYTQYTGTTCLTAGTHDLIIEYFERGANSRVSFDFTPAPTPIAPPAAVCLNSATAPTLTASSTDTNVTGFNWYSDAALTNNVGTGATFTPVLGNGAGQLDVTVVGNTSYFVTPIYPCGEGLSTTVVVSVVNGATLTITNSSVCESGGIVDLRTFVTASPAGGTFTFSGHSAITGNNFDPSGVTGAISISIGYTVGSCAATSGTLTLNVINNSTITVPTTPITVCQSGGVIDLNTLVSAVPGGGDFVFTGSTGITGDNFDPSAVTGTQTILVNYTIGGGCAAAQQQFTIDVVPAATITTTNTTVCPGGGTVNLALLVSGTPTGGTFTFSGTGVTGNIFNPAAFAGTTVTVNVTYTPAGCSPVSKTLQVIVRANNDAACGGGGSDCANFSSIQPTIITPPSCNDRDAGDVQFNIARADGTPSTFRVIWTYGSNTQTKFTSNTTNFNQLKSGLYKYTIIDEGNGKACGPVDFFLDLKTQVQIQDKQVVNNVSCFGGVDGNVVLAVDGSLTGQYWYTYVYKGVESVAQTFTPGAQLPQGLPADDTDFIILKVDDNPAFTCPDTAMVRIRNLFTKIDFAVASTSVTTCNGTDGGISVSGILGGNTATAPLQVRLRRAVPFTTDPSGYLVVADYENVVAGAKTYSDLIQGNYRVDVKDEGDCVQSKPIAVQAPGQVPLGSVNLFATDANCSNNGASGSIRVTISDPGIYKVAVSQDQVNVPDDADFVDYNSPSLPSVVFPNLSSGVYFVYLKSNNTVCPTRTDAVTINGVTALNSFEVLSSCDNVNLTLNNITGQQDKPFVIRVFSNSDKFFQIDELTQASIPISNSVSFIYTAPLTHQFLTVPGTYRFVMEQTQSTPSGSCVLVSDTVVYDVRQGVDIVLGTVKPSFPDPKRTGSIEIENIIGGTRFVSGTNELYYEVSLILPAENVVVSEYAPVKLNPQKKFSKLYEFLSPGIYRIKVRDASGCEKTQDVEISLDPSVFVPNIFTPNDDGLNDSFEVLNLPLIGSHNLIISNRWGNEVYKSSAYSKDNFWDAKNVSDGIYFYRLKVEGGETYTGWVEVLRGAKP
ncbi:gliding motility-associated C-terminal domain-containing protein [Chryseolinea lacunae]|uniref:Gliding motility-associated C-terminal domain-containing protein n=1 Tax=Chryseolinea lacunae TaxID=2801331 RepID=A0ABS1KWR9_9BACT|nr:gliding motility-associated C-terminal domain-containing protein [Chryseolinea lacunae]MBL0743824.1 gliding motility-associated C-terminal domain-containing protein [Chryseolinea lacunae]